MKKSIRPNFKLTLVIPYIILGLLLSCNTEITVDTVKEDSDKNLLPKLASFQKISTNSAIYEASDNSIDCGYYLIGIRNAQRPTTFKYNNKVYFNIPCKTSDSSAGGWHWGLASWTPGTSVNWFDGKLDAGLNEIVSRTQLDENGFIMNSVRNTYMVDSGSGILGLTYKYFRATEYNMSNVPALFSASAVVSDNGYYPVGLATSSPETFSPSDVFVDDSKYAAFFNSDDDTWRGLSHKTDLDLFYKGGTVYIYNTTQNAPTMDKYYISIITSSDMRSFTKPANYILEDFRSPHVFEYQGLIYMLAFNTNLNRWNLISGSSPTQFDPKDGQVLNFGADIFGSGGWDDTPLFTTHPDDQPEIAGVEVLNNKVYVFYMAGQFGHIRTPAHGVTGAAYDSARGIGVFELKIESD